MTWYTQLGFAENPLDFRPNAAIVGLEAEEEKLLNHITKGEICFIQGLTGSGKSSLLMRVQEKLSDFEFIYANAEDLPSDFSLDDELRKRRTWTDVLAMRKYPKKQPVLLLDEFQATESSIVLAAKGKWEAKEYGIHAMVIAQISRELANATGSFKERLGSRMISLPILKDHEMKEILRSRLYNPKTKTSYYSRLQDDAIDHLVRHANANPRRLLEYADLIFDFHFKRFKDLNPMLKETYRVSFHAVKDILTDSDIIEEMSTLPSIESLTKEEVRALQTIDRHDVATHVEVASELAMSSGAIAGIVSSLKRKGAIVCAGTKSRRKLWELSSGMKRQLVKV